MNKTNERKDAYEKDEGVDIVCASGLWALLSSLLTTGLNSQVDAVPYLTGKDLAQRLNDHFGGSKPTVSARTMKNHLYTVKVMQRIPEGRNR